MSTNYARGRAFEYRVMDYLLAGGYPFVQRAAGSHGIVDVVAVRPGELLFVQCKRHGVCSPSEWNELFDLSNSLGAIPLLAQMPGKRGIAFWRLVGRKCGASGAQPREPWA